MKEKIEEIRARHEQVESWRSTLSMDHPQAHDDRAYLLTEVDRLRAENNTLRN